MVQEKPAHLQGEQFATSQGFVEFLERTGKDRIPEHIRLDAVYVFTLTQAELDRMYDYAGNKSLKPWADIKAYMEARDIRVKQHGG